MAPALRFRATSLDSGSRATSLDIARQRIRQTPPTQKMCLGCSIAVGLATPIPDRRKAFELHPGPEEISFAIKFNFLHASPLAPTLHP